MLQYICATDYAELCYRLYSISMIQTMLHTIQNYATAYRLFNKDRYEDEVVTYRHIGCWHATLILVYIFVHIFVGIIWLL